MPTVTGEFYYNDCKQPFVPIVFLKHAQLGVRNDAFPIREISNDNN
jgi:hypothetical protein